MENNLVNSLIKIQMCILHSPLQRFYLKSYLCPNIRTQEKQSVLPSSSFFYFCHNMPLKIITPLYNKSHQQLKFNS